MTITSTQRFVVVIKAKGTKQTKRFVSKADAEKCAAGWRKNGAHATVERRVFNPPAPVIFPVTTPYRVVAAVANSTYDDILGPDAQWGGWLTAAANDALDGFELLDGIDLAVAYFMARYGKPVVIEV